MMALLCRLLEKWPNAGRRFFPLFEFGGLLTALRRRAVPCGKRLVASRSMVMTTGKVHVHCSYDYWYRLRDFRTACGSWWAAHLADGEDQRQAPLPIHPPTVGTSISSHPWKSAGCRLGVGHMYVHEGITALVSWRLNIFPTFVHSPRPHVDAISHQHHHSPQ